MLAVGTVTFYCITARRQADGSRERRGGSCRLRGAGQVMTEQPPGEGRIQVRAFILCLWQEHNAGIPGGPWRLSLQDSRTRARRGFGSLDEFFAYFERLCQEGDDDIAAER